MDSDKLSVCTEAHPEISQGGGSQGGGGGSQGGRGGSQGGGGGGGGSFH